MNISNLNNNDKRKALWLGSIAGDAFVLGGHWIYDIHKLQEKFPEYNTPQAPLPDSFHKNRKLGDQTHYGDQTRHLWQFLANNSGNYDSALYRKEWIRFISSYDGYMDAASKESLSALKKNLQFGSASDELGGTARLAAIYYWIDNPEQALSAAIDQSMMTHNNSQATAITVMIAKTLETIVQDNKKDSTLTILELLNKIRIQMIAEDKYDMNLINDSFDAAIKLKDSSAASIAEKLGQSCHARHSLPVIFAVLKQPDNYQKVMELNVRVGGDSASRALILGALLGAKLGITSIPEKWIDVMHD